jgi:hypothetical protein
MSFSELHQRHSYRARDSTRSEETAVTTETKIESVKRGIDSLALNINKIKKQILAYASLDSDERKQVRALMQEAMQIAD